LQASLGDLQHFAELSVLQTAQRDNTIAPFTTKGRYWHLLHSFDQYSSSCAYTKDEVACQAAAHLDCIASNLWFVYRLYIRLGRSRKRELLFDSSFAPYSIVVGSIGSLYTSFFMEKV
jgi:hypothetical protein